MQKFLKLFDLNRPLNQSADPNATRYAGLNIRLMANLMDMLVIILVTAPLLFMMEPPTLGSLPSDTPPEVVDAWNLHSTGQISDAEFSTRMKKSGYLQNNLVPKMGSYLIINILIVGALIVAAWRYWGSTPGKMVFGLKIVDGTTLEKPSISQHIIRFIGYFVSFIPLGLGYLIIPFNKKKKGLHDFMADTAVIYSKPLSPEWQKKKMKYQLYFVIVFTIFFIIYISSK
jgi:uncharacterized RDD family membrane protein YckC